MKPSIASQEEKIAEIVGKLGNEVLGARLKRERISQGISVRDLAARTRLGANSVVRMEAGNNCRPVNLVKVCEALGIHLDRLAAIESSDVAAVHRAQDHAWSELDDYGPGGEPNRNPLVLLGSRLPAGKLLPTLIRVNAPSLSRSHPGEEFVYVLEGSVKITIAGVPHTLSEGDSIDFWGTEAHFYEPAGDADALILSVRVNPS